MADADVQPSFGRELKVGHLLILRQMISNSLVMM